MSLNWIDIIFILILILTSILGIIKGLMRQFIGLLSVIIGLLLAVNFYPFVADLYIQLISHEVLSQFLGFMTIFLGILVIGWLISLSVPKLLKGFLKSADHIFGGGLGFLKGIFICGILVFALLLFPVNKKALKESQIAPFCLNITRTIISLIPEEVRVQFKAAYEEIMGKVNENGKKI